MPTLSERVPVLPLTPALIVAGPIPTPKEKPPDKLVAVPFPSDASGSETTGQGTAPANPRSGSSSYAKRCSWNSPALHGGANASALAAQPPVPYIRTLERTVLSNCPCSYVST